MWIPNRAVWTHDDWWHWATGIAITALRTFSWQFVPKWGLPRIDVCRSHLRVPTFRSMSLIRGEAFFLGDYREEITERRKEARRSRKQRVWGALERLWKAAALLTSSNA